MRPSQNLRDTVRADLAAMVRLKSGAELTLPRAVDVLLLPGTWSTLLFRVSAALHRTGWRPLSRLLYFANVVLFGADLAPGATIGPGLAIAHPVGMGWGGGLTAGRNLILTGLVRFGTAAEENGTRRGEPTLGDDVVMLDGAKVLGPVVLGDRCVVAANALVLTDVPPDVLVVGQPARVVRTRAERRSGPDTLATATAFLIEAAPDLGVPAS